MLVPPFSRTLTLTEREPREKTGEGVEESFYFIEQDKRKRREKEREEDEGVYEIRVG